MSTSNPILPGQGGAPIGISDVVSNDDLQRFAGIVGVIKELGSVPSECVAPSKPMPLPLDSAKTVQQNLCAALRAMGVPSWIAYIWSTFWAGVVLCVAVVSTVMGQISGGVVGPLLAVFLTALDGLRKGIDPAIGILAVGILQELLGSEFSTTHLATSTDVSAHIARAGEIGALLTGQLTQEFAPANGGVAVPSAEPAERFTGFAINFGVATGILAGIGGLIPFGHINELRELGEEVARNIGLGRLVRQALTPLVHTMVAQPYQWWLNTKYLPTQFSEANLVNIFAQTTLPHDQLYNAMHLLGYSDDKIAAFIQMHEKKLTPAQVQTLINWGFWTQQDGLTYIARLGWPGGFAGNVLQLENLHEVSPWITKEVDLLLSEVGSGQLTVNEFAQTIDQFALGQPVKDVLAALANYRAAKSAMHRPARLSEGELEHAYDAGLLTAQELSDHWTAQGLPPADQDVRMQLILLRLSRLETVAKERQQHYVLQLAAFKAKQAAKPTGAAPPMPPIAPFPLSS